jgi:CHAT domain-containing protein/tetratricopeptide (TPR) repeat protein
LEVVSKLLRDSNSHLGPDELSRLAEVDKASSQGNEGDAARQHIATCDACADRLRVMRLMHLNRANSGMEAAEQSPLDCPDEGIWTKVAAGFLSSTESSALLEHASACNRCASQLRAAMESMHGEFTPEEQNLLLQLRSRTPEWRRETARQLAQISGEENATHRVEFFGSKVSLTIKRFFAAWYSWATVAALLGLVATVGFWTVRSRSSLSSVNRLIADAYTQERTLELRIPNAKYAELRMQRGTTQSVTSHPQSLLRAETRIAAELGERPSDSAWLQAQGRADLLDGNYDSAVAALEKALELEPNSPEIKIDLASAYFQRGGTSANSLDSTKAMEFLGDALATAPDSPIGIFNRAVISEHMLLYTQAEADWEHYLRLDPHGDWAEEARRHLGALRDKLKKHEDSSTVPLLSPAVLARSTDRAQVLNTVDRRFEEYLHVVLRDWLPQAYPLKMAGPKERNDTSVAVGFVASVANSEHKDHWLHDLLANSTAPTFPAALAALSGAVKATDRGDYASSQKLADIADQLFRRSGNTAGSLRAELEKLFALHLSQDGSACVSHASVILRALNGYAYQWLQIQSRLEQAVCLSMMGNLGESERVTAVALQMSRDYRYPTLMLRAIGLASDTDLAIGDVKLGWSRSFEGLTEFWVGSYSAMQGYNLYTNLDTAADLLGRPHLQLAIWQQALSLINSDEDTLLRAMAHSWTANAAYMADVPLVAEQEYAEADRLFTAAPQTDSTLNDRIEAETWFARLMAKRGASNEALTLLMKIQSRVATLSNDYVRINFYSALGEVQLRRGSIDEAGQPLLEATRLAEKSLTSLFSESERIAWGREAALAYRGLVEWEIREGRPQQALEVWEWYRAAAMRTRKHHPSVEPIPTRLETISTEQLSYVTAHLPRLKSETALSYAILPDGLAIWTYDERGVSAQWSPEQLSAVTQLADRFKTLCSSPKTDPRAIRRDAQKLYDILISPVETRIASRSSLLVEVDGPLSGLPFEALINRNGSYLADEAPITYSLGDYYRFSATSQLRFSPDSSAVVVAVPTNLSGDRLPPLPDALTEGEIVAGDFRHGRLLKSDQATFDRVKSELSASAVFHFAGHAVLSNGAPALVLADSDWKTAGAKLINAESLAALRLHQTQLVVLSACATERAGDAGFDDPDSLAHAFLRAGVPHVLASHWPMDSHATSTFMQNFYGELLSGESVSTSVQKAAAFVRSNRNTSHPYYWSAFGAFGQE